MAHTTETTSTSPASTADSRDRRAALFVWGIWILLFVNALAFIRQYGCNMPCCDDWAIVPAVTGNEPITLAFLWSQHNEHRVPLPRLIILGLAQLTGFDVRAVMYLNAALLGLLAAGLIRAMKALRGWTAYADALFPLAILVGHHSTLLWECNVGIALSTLLCGGLLMLVMRSHQPLTGRTVLLGGAYLTLLPLTGASGVPFVPPLALWLVYWAVRHYRTSGAGGGRLLVLALGLATAGLVLVGLYLHDFHRPTYLPPSPGLRASLRVSREFLTVGCGKAVADYWPYCGYAAAGLLLAVGAAVVRAGWKQPAERPRALGLLAFLAAMLALALSIGIGRAGLRPDYGFTDHYVTLAVPALGWLYLAVMLAGPGWARLMHLSLFTWLCALLLTNLHLATSFGQARQADLKAVERDVRSGLPAGVIAQKHWRILWPRLDPLVERMEMLRRAGLGKFRLLSPPPAVHEIAIPVAPAHTQAITWQDGTAAIAGHDSCEVFTLDRPRFVYAIRLTYAYDAEPEEAAWFHLAWSRSRHGGAAAAAGDAVLLVDTQPGTHHVVVYVHDAIDRFDIHPDIRPCAFTLKEIQLLASGVE